MIVLGGTFDPIHCGHIRAGKQASLEFDSATVRLMLAKEPLLRSGPIADVADRWTMVQLACENEPNLKPCDLEIRREGPTRTVDTLQQLVAATDTHVIWVLSTDALAQMPSWYRYSDIPHLSSLFVFRRPGHSLSPMHGEFEQVHEASRLLHSAGLVYVSDVKMPQVSATEIRQSIRAGNDVAQVLPTGVHKHIIGRALYK